MRAACVLVLALTAGCNHMQASGGSLYVQTGPAVLGALGLAVLAANIDARNGTSPMPSAPAPQMLADRTVVEQDCTKPIEDWSANLKCR